MNKDNFSHWLSLVANFGVIVGIVFLTLEINQTNLIAMVSAEYEFRNSGALINESIYTNPELAAFVYHINNTEQEEFTEVEHQRAYALALRLLNLWLGAESAYRSGIASEMIYNNILDDIRNGNIDTSPAMRKIWRELISDYSALGSTVVFTTIDQLLREQGN
ncbi:MAG: hypothetical protein QGG67_02420 [Gammaproteobacteria bacterium]|jgi:hypothetical protein|nr:hypothetical protein [Gammaproteobacteria bacterium]HJO12504.1 hypothetical protein [Gammaproteobacteria bacterium]|tara:strand:+ start:6463 stop:6951 length:489 start_codon:yes stop_codon:yes gene_type:complete